MYCLWDKGRHKKLFFYFWSKGGGWSRPIQKILIRKYSDFFLPFLAILNHFLTFFWPFLTNCPSSYLTCAFSVATSTEDSLSEVESIPLNFLLALCLWNDRNLERKDRVWSASGKRHLCLLKNIGMIMCCRIHESPSCERFKNQIK